VVANAPVLRKLLRIQVQNGISPSLYCKAEKLVLHQDNRNSPAGQTIMVLPTYVQAVLQTKSTAFSIFLLTDGCE